MVSSYTMGGFIHLLLLLAIIVVLIRVITDAAQLLEFRRWAVLSRASNLLMRFRGAHGI
jgi:hypothetical protein